MVKEKWVEIMKIFCTTKRKTRIAKDIDISISIRELESLIDFLNDAKDAFCERMKDCSIAKVVTHEDDSFEIVTITNYTEAKSKFGDTIDYHMHYCDWEKKLDCFPSIVIHTNYKMVENEDGTFKWKNINAFD